MIIHANMGVLTTGDKKHTILAKSWTKLCIQNAEYIRIQFMLLSEQHS